MFWFSVLTFLGLLIPTAVIAAPPDIWPLKVTAPTAATLQKELSRIDNVASKLPLTLKPAVQWQKTFLQILSRAKESEWTGDLQRFIAADPGSGTPATIPDFDPIIAHGIADLCRAWIARTEMEQIDGVLHKFYRKHVAFPDQLQAVDADLAEAIRKDPWGEPWIYRPHAPAELGAGFAKFTTQRYQLGPTRFPSLTPLKEAIGNRNPLQPKWKVAPHDLAGKKALEFRSDATVTTIEPDGKVDGMTLLFIGDTWALMAGVDQLFTVTF